MQKAIFFEEAYHQGVLAKLTEGFILSVTSPDSSNLDRNQDPFLVELVSYSGVKSVTPVEGGVKFSAQGKKFYCMLQPAGYTGKAIEPSLRPQGSTAFMPFRLSECEKEFYTKDTKYIILIPKKPHDCYDSFTISFPSKGDLCVLYYIFSKNIKGDVIPFIKENFGKILRSTLSLRTVDSSNISKKFTDSIIEHGTWKQD